MIDWLVGTLLATSGLILLVLLVREPVRRHFGARVAYGLWLIPAARLLINSTRAEIPLPQRNDLVVGREDPMSNSYPDVDLGPYGGLDLGVSRRHFRLTRNGDNVYLEDLNAMNGSIVNGQRVPPYTLHPLRSGDRIVLGKMELVFELS